MAVGNPPCRIDPLPLAPRVATLKAVHGWLVRRSASINGRPGLILESPFTNESAWIPCDPDPVNAAVIPLVPEPALPGTSRTIPSVQ